MGIKRPPDANSYREEDEEDLPRVVRKASREDDEDTPRPRQRPPVQDDDEDEPAPRSRRRVADDDEDQDAPAAPRRRPARDPDPEEPGRRDRDAPRRWTGPPKQRDRTEDDYVDENEEDTSPTSARVAAGWGAAKAMQAEGNDYNNEFKLTDEPTLIKFLSDDPFAVYKQHFLREKDGKKSYVCLGSGCPLCDDLGHTPDKKFAFTVVDLTGETFGASQLVAGPKLLRILETHNGGKYGPLSRNYWEINRIGQGLKTDYGLSPVRDRYLTDDYGLDPVKIERILSKIKQFTSDDIRQTTKAELREIAAELDS